MEFKDTPTSLKLLKFVVMAIALIILVAWSWFVVGNYIIPQLESNKNVSIEVVGGSSDVIKTVAHIPLDERKYKLIYKDTDNDIAYYMVLDTSRALSIGDTVITSNGDETTVRAVDVYGFYVDYNDVFYPGMSGTVIRDEYGESVGYVSKLIDSDSVYCIWN